MCRPLRSLPKNTRPFGGLGNWVHTDGEVGISPSVVAAGSVGGRVVSRAVVVGGCVVVAGVVVVAGASVVANTKSKKETTAG